jgi:hypothetical protein
MLLFACTCGCATLQMHSAGKDDAYGRALQLILGLHGQMLSLLQSCVQKLLALGCRAAVIT